MKHPRRFFAAALLLAFFAIAALAQYPQSPPVTPPQNLDWPTQPVRGAKAMVVSDEKLAADVGAEIMQRGGNAIDAAVAVGFTLAVVDPEAGNIGGGGFMLIRLANGRTSFIDYREAAPANASRDMYVKSDGSVDPQASIVGYRSVAVPGTVAGLALALKNYGSMKLADVMAPAIRLAEKGFPVSPGLAASLRSMESIFSQFPASRRIFLKDGAYYQPGDTLRQPELAATLKRIAKEGPAGFYSGITARNLAAEMKRAGGLITLEDLAHYKPEIREPLTASYKANGHDWFVITSPPPSSGGVAAIEALNILAPLELKSWNDVQSIHWVVEAMRRAFADRAMYLADPAFAKIPLRGMMSTCYADALRRTIDLERASSSDKIRPGNPAAFENVDSSTGPCPQVSVVPAPGVPEEILASPAPAQAAREGHTTHFSVVDPAGNAVSNTYTLNNLYGSGVTTSDGYFLNDEMDDFTSSPGASNMYGLIQSEANAIAPGKRPLSSMMPTIVLRDGQLSFVTGARGGPRIISGTLLSILNWMRLGDGAQIAIRAPRFHQQWLPDTVLLEPQFPAAIAKELEARGYKLADKPGWVALVEAVAIDPKTGERLGAPDPRRPGAASGF
ncbi:MAG TPA: gamma-glutamyltransferase [Candidatus Acidoferrum sp.]|nr:gamma-glutamyltransferase [Candidatus Acidoferrum sp.]